MCKHILQLLCVSALGILLIGCADRPLHTGSSKRPKTSGLTELQFAAPQEGDPIAILSTSLGDISLILYPEHAPMAVENFTGLAQQGYYDGLPFHRVVEGFLIQTGDAGGTGTGGTTIWDGNSFPNEISDQLHHYSGAVAMAHPQDSEAGNRSQFYIVQSSPDSVDEALAGKLADAGVRQSVIESYRKVGGTPYLDNLDTVFGQVYAGMDVVDAIGAAECDDQERPAEEIIVNSVTISSYSSPPPADSETASSDP